MASHFFTSRYGGVSEGAFHENNLALHVGDVEESVLRNRRHLTSIVGDIVFMNQSHGDCVVLVDDTTSTEPAADAMITRSSGLNLAVLAADCIPLLLWDGNAQCVAAVHVGRKGLMNGIAVKTVEKMQELGSENIRGVLGPSICGKCYEVGEDIFDEVSALFPLAKSHSTSGKRALDLAGALQDQLQELKIDTARASSCTREEQSLFSYRRDGVTGRIAGVISL